LSLINPPSIAKLVHDVHLTVHDINGSLKGDIIQSDDTIRDSLGLDELDPSDFGGVVGMCSTTGFSIDTLNVNNSKLISWNHTTLIKMESILLLSLSFVHEALMDIGALVNDSISSILNSSLLLFCERLVVSDIQMSNFSCLLCTILPNMWAKDLSARCENNMSSCMMCLQLLSSNWINGHVDSLALKVTLKWSI